jgi:ankyrin repeat protein
MGCRRRIPTALEVLLRHPSIDINLKDTRGRSPLSRAAGNGQRGVVSTLVHPPGIDKTTKDDDMRNAVSRACQGGHADTLHTLLGNGCAGEDDADVDSWPPLLWALFNRSPATVEALLSTRRVQIDRQDRYGHTAGRGVRSIGSSAEEGSRGSHCEDAS